MSTRGGRQRIPRPPTARAGAPPPWARLAPADRTFTLAQVRERCARLAPPRPPQLVVPGSRAAAVLMTLFEENGEARVVLTKRPEHMPSHRGEIAFPGGTVQPDVDHTVLDAALREAEEEIGLSRGAVEVAAELDGISTVASRFTITPFVGLLDQRPTLVPDPREVEAILDVGLAELLDDGVYREERWDIGLPDRAIHFFELPGETVWGATARILFSFLDHLVADR
ncbi:MAG TPA: CoA pyrophosphatase [Acidimicrobiia bacterium]